MPADDWVRLGMPLLKHDPQRSPVIPGSDSNLPKLDVAGSIPGVRSNPSARPDVVFAVSMVVLHGSAESARLFAL
jgi:hypothetical protein